MLLNTETSLLYVCVYVHTEGKGSADISRPAA